MSDGAAPILSIVIPTMGRPILLQTLNSLSACHDFDRTEVLVCGKIKDEAVLAGVQEILAAHPNVRHYPVSFEVGDSSEKKNYGAREARAAIVAFLDDDVKVAPHWPRKMLEPFEDSETQVVSGPSLVPEDVNLFARVAGVAMSSPAAGYVMHRYRKDDAHAFPIKWSKIIGCNMAYRKTAFEAVGGFDPKFWPGEEMIAAHRVERSGRRILFQPEAWVFHYPRQSLWRFCKQIHGYGATRIRLLRSGVEFEATTLIPALWVASLIALIPLSFFLPLARWLLALDLALYALADLWFTAVAFMETRKLRDLLVFFLIPIVHLTYGLAGWIEFLRPGKDLSEHFAR